jgi:hypothetical protein
VGAAAVTKVKVGLKGLVEKEGKLTISPSKSE